jgi:hypothetical protein
MSGKIYPSWDFLFENIPSGNLWEELALESLRRSVIIKNGGKNGAKKRAGKMAGKLYKKREREKWRENYTNIFHVTLFWTKWRPELGSRGQFLKKLELRHSSKFELS